MTDEECRIQELAKKINEYAISLQKEGYKPFEIMGALGVVSAIQIEELAHKDAAIKYFEGLINGIKEGSGPTLN